MTSGVWYHYYLDSSSTRVVVEGKGVIRRGRFSEAEASSGGRGGVTFEDFTISVIGRVFIERRAPPNILLYL